MTILYRMQIHFFIVLYCYIYFNKEMKEIGQVSGFCRYSVGISLHSDIKGIFLNDLSKEK